MLYLYLDESGDLGFDFINAKPSKFFTICILLIKNKKDKNIIERAINRTLKNKINPKNKTNRFVEELKGTQTSLPIKEYFYNQIRNIDFEIYALTLNKRRVIPELLKNKSRVYNWIARMLLDKIKFSDIKSRIIFTLDKSKGLKGIKEFNSYIGTQLESGIDPKTPLDIFHLDSKEINGLQAVDLFAWGVMRKHERNDIKWFDIFSSKIKYNEIYLP